MVNGNTEAGMSAEIAEQVALLKRGTVEVFREDELAQRLTEAAKTVDV